MEGVGGGRVDERWDCFGSLGLRIERGMESVWGVLGEGIWFEVLIRGEILILSVLLYLSRFLSDFR